MADAFTEWNMHIKSQTITFRKRQLLVVFIFKDKWFSLTIQPHPGQVRYNPHNTPKYISNMSLTFL